jgi:hypothetical protein
MKQVLRRRPRPAMIVAIVALVVAMAGTAVAGSAFLPSKKFKKFKSTAVTRLTYVNNTQSVHPSTGATDFTKVSATCPAGYHPVGGGVKLSPDDDNVWWDDGYLTVTGYSSKVFNGLATNGQALVTVACVAASATGSPSAG